MKVKEVLTLSFKLFLIASLTSLLLSFVNSFTSEKISEATSKKTDEMKKVVLTGASTFSDNLSSDSSFELYEGKDENGNTLGYAVLTSAFGYGGEIKMLVGVLDDFTASGVSIISLSETAGLGSKAKDESFLSQFKGKESFRVGEEIKAISGATITSKAITKGVNDAISFVRGYVN